MNPRTLNRRTEMNEQEIRLECLKLAAQYGASYDDKIATARAYADFVLGTRDAEIISAARVLAEKVG